MAASSIPKILWQPSERAIEEAQLTQFARQVIRKRKLDANSYSEFYRWSVDNPEEFWSDAWDFCGVIASRKGSTVLTDGDKMPGAHWFPEARLNLAQNLLRRGDRGDAFVFWDETGFKRRVSYSELTALSPILGYTRSTEIAREALASGKKVFDLVLEKKLMTRAQLEEVLQPEMLTKPHFSTVQKPKSEL